jgi:glycosyltransferase involved in cell wall biosynthesis
VVDAYDDKSSPAVTFVVTTGHGSMDLYSQRLAPHLGSPVLVSDVYRESARHFGLRHASWRALRAGRADLRFVRALRRVDGPVHLPNHHLARYGPLTGRPYVVTVHDLIRWTDQGRECPFIARPNSRDRLLLTADCRGIRQAAGVVAVSATTASDLVERLGLPEDRVAVARNGVDHETFHPGHRRLFDFPYVLFVGSEQPRKNVGALLAAMARLLERPGLDHLRLVKVGEPGGDPRYRQATLARVRELGLGDRVLFTGWLSDRQLAAAYVGATCLVVPSLYEGFGLPPVEAMACGCPVIASSHGSLTEVLGDAALRVPSCEPEAIADAIRRVAEDRRLAAALSERGLRRAGRFTWQRAAAATRAAYARFADAFGQATARPDAGAASVQAPALDAAA